MKRGDLLRHLRDKGCLLGREGGRHTIYVNPANGLSAGVPRHTEIDNRLARKICRELGVEKPAGS
ncbi:MAG: type II toxin-antitoxin system HicA family toxin [Fimbriimonas ginsengisoli]|uniref:Type II toxin-antitoxin system HicA family toxin n=1 Tax=Fimbriimonas ginsengisoli TaxID=1005039 RepID=A0A931PUI6_FIMGI|nr:type II toxin-antitoxin system HicA family toxin [Fimbriimonas ginsengisoli]